MAKRKERRIVIGNDRIRLDFDPRTSDTMYNYIWVWRPDTERWLRVHNFGIDVRSYLRGKPEELVNTVGMHLSIQVDGRKAAVRYPSPLFSYGEVGDAKSLEAIHNYPDLPRNYGDLMAVCDASLSFEYEVHQSRPSFVVSGKVLRGRVLNVVYIIDALWTDNHQLPTHVCCEGFQPYANHDLGETLQYSYIENVAYAIFFRMDGLGVPFAYLPLRPDRSTLCDHFDNSYCLSKFRLASTNQAYIPDDPPVTDSNDVGYTVEPDADGTLRGVRVAFFPELGWGRGSTGHVLLERIESAIEADYLDAARSWKRREQNKPAMWTWMSYRPF